MTQRNKVRYVQTHDMMMRELIELGLNGSRVLFPDGIALEGDHLRTVVKVMQRLEEPLETLERRGLTLRHLSQKITDGSGALPQYRVSLSRVEHWFHTKADRDAFIEAEQARLGQELDLAADPEAGAKPDAAANSAALENAVHVTDLHEVRSINEILRELKGYGIGLKDLYPPGARDGETVYPFRIEQDEHSVRLMSLRDLLIKLRELGEKGMKVTRFKGLGEMDPEELWDTSMMPEHRTLLRVTMDDAAAADEMFRILMGDQVEPRREFIEKHALDVKDLDV